MDEFVDRLSRFKAQVLTSQKALYERLATHGQSPKALMISCADSRVVPELITQSNPGDLFVCRNAGNIVPPFSQANGGVSSAVEYAVVALGVRDIIVCGHSDCGAMKAVLNPESLVKMPNVAAWLEAQPGGAQRGLPRLSRPRLQGRAPRHGARERGGPDQPPEDPPVGGGGLAQGSLTLHGWFFEIETYSILALDGETGTFGPVGAQGRCRSRCRPAAGWPTAQASPLVAAE